MSVQRGWHHQWPEGRRLGAKSPAASVLMVQRSWLGFKLTFALFIKEIYASQILSEKMERKNVQPL